MKDMVCEIDNVTKFYGSYQALHGIKLTVREGEFIAIVGPSGSGKSTLLQIISGFEQVDGGTLKIDGKDMVGVSPAHRPTSMVFQKLALFPHKTVADNIGFPLKLRGLPKEEIAKRTTDIMALMELKPEYLTRYPRQLSGGEQQRVALARSMIQHPKLLLLDEPLSALDVKLKKVLQAELKRLHRSIGLTFIHVTHDLEEAMMLADNVCVMQGGRLLQVGAPNDIYHRPATRFVAEFIGDTNLIPVRITAISDTDVADYVAIGDDSLKGRVTLPHGSTNYHAGMTTDLMIRPEFLQFRTDAAPIGPQVPVRIAETFMRGSTIQIKAKAAGKLDELLFTVELSGYTGPDYEIGSDHVLEWSDEHAFLLPKTKGPGA